MSFDAVLSRVSGKQKTLSVYNADLAPAVRRRIEEYFEPQQVRLRSASTDDGLPRNFAILHNDDEFVAAASVETLAHALDVDTGINAARTVEDVDYPEILAHIDNTTFTEYGKRRMIIASREIETQAWDVRSGELHTGFQRLSLIASQRRVYSKLSESPVDVHVYGEPDVEVPERPGLNVHASEDEEIATSWFVVYDGDGDDERKCALLATEVRDNEYTGFWTYDADLVGELLQYIRATYA